MIRAYTLAWAAAVFVGCSYEESLGVAPADAAVAVDPPDAATVFDAAPPTEARAFIHIGGPGYDEVSALAVTSDGDLVIAGSFYGSATFDGTAVDGAGAEDGFVARYSPTGERRWLTLVSGADTDRVLSLAVGPGDAIAAAGSFVGSAVAGTEVLTGVDGSDGFAMELDGATGEVQWAVAIAGTGQDEAHGVAFHGANVVVAGSFEGAVDLVGEPADSAGSSDIYLIELAPNGAPTWRRHYGGDGRERVRGLAVSPTTGEILIAGELSGRVDFGHGEQLSGTSVWGIVAAYASDGTPATFALMVSSIDTWTSAVVADATGAVTAVGRGKLGGLGASDVLLRKLTPDMQEDIIRDELGGDGEDSASGVAVDDAGRITIAGGFSSSWPLDDALLSRGRTDALAAILAPDGTPIASFGIGGVGSDTATAARTLAPSAVAIAGSFEQTVTLGTRSVTSEGESDGFVAVLDY